MPRFSVILPARNAEQYLHGSVGSLLSQNFQDYELLLVVNASTDATLRIAEDYTKSFSHISLLYTETPGVSNARNLGLAQAQGEYIVFLDADDFYFPYALGSLHQALLQQPCDIMIGSFGGYAASQQGGLIPASPQGLLLTLLDRPLHPADGHPDLEGHTLMLRGPWGKAYRRNFLKQHHLRFESGYTVHEDLIFNRAVLRSATSATVLCLPLYAYATQRDSCSRRSDAAFVQEHTMVANLLLAELRTLDPQERAATAYRILRIIFEMVEACARAKDDSVMTILKAFIEKHSVQYCLQNVRNHTLFMNPRSDALHQIMLHHLRHCDVKAAINCLLTNAKRN